MSDSNSVVSIVARPIQRLQRQYIANLYFRHIFYLIRPIACNRLLLLANLAV